MSEKTNKNGKRTKLRDRAEKKLDGQPTQGMDATPNEKKLLHELQVHQMELEMQNEALHQLETPRKPPWRVIPNCLTLRLSPISTWRLTAGSCIRIFAAPDCWAATAAI
jgi:hypothetical protein